MKSLLVCAAAVLALAGIAQAQTGFTITGSMSNFDCSNHCDYPCDEMEIEIEGIHPEDVLHTYHNGNYGSPTVTLSADGSRTIVDYRNPLHLTAVNSIEHFGVTIRGAAYYVPAPYHPTRVHWYRDGHRATVNGQVPTENGGSAPATQPMQPSISATVTAGSHGTGGVSLTVTNNDPVQSIWIKRRAQVTAAAVTLEALMPNDPLVTTSVTIDPSPIKLAPSQTFTVSRDLIEIEEDQSVVFAAQYYQNIVVQSNDPFDPNNHESFGPELGNIMTATQTSPVLACVHHPASITEQPPSVTQDAGTRVDLRVRAQGDDTSPLVYQWLKEGVAISNGNGFSGTDSAHLRIDELTPAFEGFYAVRVTNDCISATSDSALVFITGHNLPPARVTLCPGDFNSLGGTNVQDIFDFLSAWFVGSPSANFNQLGGTDVQDIFDFLSAWFSGC